MPALAVKNSRPRGLASIGKVFQMNRSRLALWEDLMDAVERLKSDPQDSEAVAQQMQALLQSLRPLLGPEPSNHAPTLSIAAVRQPIQAAIRALESVDGHRLSFKELLERIERSGYVWKESDRPHDWILKSSLRGRNTTGVVIEADEGEEITDSTVIRLPESSPRAS